MKKILFILLLGVVVMCGCSKKEVKVGDYFKVESEGYDGFGTAKVVLDKEGLEKELVSKKILSEEKAKSWVESIEYEEEHKNVSNGQKLKIEFKNNSELIKKKNVNLDFQCVVEDLVEPVQYDPFKEVKVKISGVSPKAIISVTNNTMDPYLMTIPIKVEPEGFVKIGDKVVVSLQIDEQKEGEAGRTFTSIRQEYIVGEIGSYPEDGSQLDNKVLLEVDKLNQDTIKAETEDSTKHMLWRVTELPKYLLATSVERVESIELLDVYYLYEKEKVLDRTNNYLYYVYKAIITDGSSKETGYFIFEYKDVVANKGTNIISQNQPEDRYVCGVTLDKNYKDLIESKLEEYELEKITGLE